MAGDQPTHCLNCGTVVDDSFCPRCGQKNTSYRVSLWLVLKEMLGEAFELDGRVPRTLVPFFFQPGRLTREYNAGKRASYTSPFRLFLAMTLLWVAVGFVFTKTTDYEAKLAEQGSERVIGFHVPEGEPIPDPDAELSPVELRAPESSAITERLEARTNQLGEMSQAEQAELVFESGLDALPKALLLLLPVFALVLKVLFAGTGRYYVEHLVFALHTHAMAFFVLTLSFIVEDEVFRPLLMVGFGAYVFLALRNAYEARWWTTLLRFFALTIVYGALAGAVIGIMFLAMLLV